MTQHNSMKQVRHCLHCNVLTAKMPVRVALLGSDSNPTIGIGREKTVISKMPVVTTAAFHALASASNVKMNTTVMIFCCFI